jgi:hypothetical protein
MDAPEPEKNFAAYLRAVERYVVETAEPVLTYEQILDAADVERSARFTEFALQKNYEMVDFIIEGQPRIDPMMSGKKMNRLEYTQTLTKKTHPMEVTDD